MLFSSSAASLGAGVPRGWSRTLKLMPPARVPENVMPSSLSLAISDPSPLASLMAAAGVDSKAFCPARRSTSPPLCASDCPPTMDTSPPSPCDEDPAVSTTWPPEEDSPAACPAFSATVPPLPAAAEVDPASTVTEPAGSAALAPTDARMLPACEWLDGPVDRRTVPDRPCARPVSRAIPPELPSSPPAGEESRRPPLFEVDDAPDETRTSPPSFETPIEVSAAVLLPAAKLKAPPFPWSPLPTDRDIAPPVPPMALAEATSMLPESATPSLSRSIHGLRGPSLAVPPAPD